MENELIAAVRKLVKAKGRYHTEQNYKALADALAAYDATATAQAGDGLPSLSDLETYASPHGTLIRLADAKVRFDQFARHAQGGAQQEPVGEVMDKPNNEFGTLTWPRVVWKDGLFAAPPVGTKLYAAPVSAPGAQQGDDVNGGMHASIFVKIWGDAGGGDAGRIALANYAYAIGRRDAVREYITSRTQSPAVRADVPDGVDDGVSATYAWLGRAARCGIAEVEHSARTMMAYYQGAEFPAAQVAQDGGSIDGQLTGAPFAIKQAQDGGQAVAGDTVAIRIDNTAPGHLTDWSVQGDQQEQP